MSLKPSALPGGSPLTIEALRDVLGIELLQAALATPYLNQAAGEAGTTTGQYFAVDAGGGTVSIYLRTGGGSTLKGTVNISGVAGGGGGGGGGGTVTSIALATGTGISVTGASPITSSGSWLLTLSAFLQTWSGIDPASKSDVGHTHTFSSLTSKPTTLAGYGINDAAALSHSHTFSSLTGKPTTVAGYGIVDAVSTSVFAADTGDSLVGYKQTGTGAVARTLANLIDDGPLYAKDFGCAVDGTTDDTVALQAAITAAIAQKRELILPAGTFKITAPLNAVGILRMRGAGSGSFAYGPLAAVNTTVIKMVNVTNQSHVLKLENSNTGGHLEAIQIDANEDALVGLDIKSVLRGTFSDVYVQKGLTYCVRLWCNDNANTMFCTFTNMQINSTFAGAFGLYISGANPNSALANSCHNVFINTKIDYAGLNSEGIRVGNSDNNIFYQTYIYSPNATEGYGVALVNESVALFPMGTGFYHLQTSIKGMYVQSGLNDNYVYGYACDNAQPDPTWNPSTSRFFWTDGAGRISNVRSLKEVSVESGNPIRFNGYLTGNTHMLGNASAIQLTVNGVVQANFGSTSLSFTQAASFASDVILDSGNRLRLNGAANLHGIRWSSPNIELFVGASFAAGFGANTVGFNGTTPVAKGTITGSRGGNAALASLLTYLASTGLLTDSSS